MSPQPLVVLALLVTVLATGATPQAQEEGLDECSGPFRLEVPGSLCPFWETRLCSDSSCGPPAVHTASTGNGFQARSCACWGAGAGRIHTPNLPRRRLSRHSSQCDPRGHPAWCQLSAGRARGRGHPKLRTSFPLLAVTRHWEGRGWIWWQRLPVRKSPGSGAQ